MDDENLLVFPHYKSVSKAKSCQRIKSLLVEVDPDHSCERVNLIAELKNLRNIVAHRSKSSASRVNQESKYLKDVTTPNSKELEETPDRILPEKISDEGHKIQGINIFYNCNCSQRNGLQHDFNYTYPEKQETPVQAAKIESEEKSEIVKEEPKKQKRDKSSKYVKYARRFYNDTLCPKPDVPCHLHGGDFIRKRIIKNSKTQTTPKSDFISPAKTELVKKEKKRKIIERNVPKRIEVVRSISITSIGPQMNPKMYLSERLRKKLPLILRKEVGQFNPNVVDMVVKYKEDNRYVGKPIGPIKQYPKSVPKEEKPVETSKDFISALSAELSGSVIREPSLVPSYSGII